MTKQPVFSVLVLGFFIFLSACASKQKAASGPESMDKTASIQYQFSYEFFQKGDLIRALSACLKGIESAPKSADLHNLLGLIYFRQREFDQAEIAFKKASQIAPDLPEVYANLGAMYYETKRYSDARDVLLKGLQFPLYLNPERLHNNLGLVYEALKDFDQAESSYRAAIVAKPNYFLPYQNLGRMLMDQEKGPQAKAMLLEAVRLCPTCPDARYHLGTAYLKQNEKRDAIAQFKAGAEQDPKGYYGQLCQQFLLDNKKTK